MTLEPYLDIHMTEEGEPVIDPTGDFAKSEGESALLESVMYRLKTAIGDWVLVPECGASLEALIGKPNSRETGELMTSLINRALTHDGFLISPELQISTIPVNSQTIMSVVKISRGDEGLELVVSLDLKEGKIAFLNR